MSTQMRVKRALQTSALVLMSFFLTLGQGFAQEPDFHDLLQVVRAATADGARSAPGIVAPPGAQGRAEQSALVRAQDLADLYHSTSKPIFGLVVKGFEAGLTLEGIQQLSDPYLTWSDWPYRIGLDSAVRPTGFDNNAANQTAEDSLREQVVLIYREHRVSADLQLIYLQTSYCFPKVHDQFFWRSVDMGVIIRSPGEVRLTRLQYPLGNEWVVGKIPGLFPLLLGFLQLPEREMPLILVGQAPSGTQRNCSVYMYLWSDEQNEWLHFKLISMEHVGDLMFDPDTSNLLMYSGYALNEATGQVDVPILNTSIHVPTFLKEHIEYVKEHTGIDLFD